MNIKDHFHTLRSTGLFSGISDAELESVLDCVGAQKKVARKGKMILQAGDRPRHVGIVLAGQLHVVREDYDGNRSLISVLTPGDTFDEALCCAGVSESPVSVIAGLDSTVMLLSFERILHICTNACLFHGRLVENMLGLIAGKNLAMQSHMEILSMKTIRLKVMRHMESLGAKKDCEIAIPFSRDELANYLCVDRSALSHELSRMRRDGLIDYRKNRFVLR